ncbi:MAG: excinuclease ABC subunit UvrC [Acidobacteriota bacterium]|nr:excinuclease ABC subunit UvrC [Acidobacteriota bacterium]
MVNDRLQHQLDELPKSSGVYLFNDARGKLLYVGKARNLRARVRSYFRKSDHGPRIRKLVQQIHHLEIVVTETEGEALLLENSFIKNNKPVFNVLLRDDKTYPYIKITAEEFPRVVLTRRKTGGGRYFGPFPSTRAARQSIKLIHQHFKVRSCDLELGARRYRPCLQYHIKRCDAPCDFLVDEAAYATGVERAALFLEGKTDDLVQEISTEMKAAAAELAFERAAYFRDLLGLVTSVQRRQNVTGMSYDRMDVVTSLVEGWQIAILIMAIRNGNIVRSQHFKVEYEEDPAEDLGNWLTHYYLNHEDPPEELVVSNDAGLALLPESFAGSRGRKLSVVVPQRGTKKRLLEMARETIHANLEMQRRDADVHPGVTQLADILELSNLPSRMECFDISNTQGTLSVASMVSFNNGKPDKSNYRKFNIKTVEGPNDFASMEEVVQRRYKRLLDEGEPLPDLIVIDGGLGQLHAAHKSLKNLGLADHPLISLAKREEWVYRTRDNEPVIIPHEEPALRMLQHIRDEAHRFGITFHRKKRGKNMLTSELDAIPGLGPKRIHKLLHHFGSVKRVRDAGLDQLAAVVGKKTAEVVLSHLKPG